MRTHSSPSRRAIVVLGDILKPDGKPSPLLEGRLSLALQLAKEHPSAKVIVSGGAVGGSETEASVMATWLEARGLEPRGVVREDQSITTLENAEKVAAVLRVLGVDHVDLVTSRFHMRRARALFRGALDGFDVKVTPQRAPDDFGRKERLARVSHEGVALVCEGLNQQLLHRGRPKLFNGRADRAATGRPRVDPRALAPMKR